MNKTITKNLRKLRQGKRLTQEYVAERLGVSAKAVSRWENQKWKLNLVKPGQHFVCITLHSANRLSRLPKGYICGAFESEFPGSFAFPNGSTAADSDHGGDG